MPGFVKTPKDEKRWSAAKSAAAKSKGKAATDLKDDDFALANYIYHKMGKTEEDEQIAQELKKGLLKVSTSVPSTKVPNPSKVGSTAVKMPKSKKMADPFGKPSLFFKTEIEEFHEVKHPSLCKLRDFLKNTHGKKHSKT